jgi:hypothetical protein
VRFSTRGVKKHQKSFLEKVHVKKKSQRSEGGKNFSLVIFFFDFFIAFLAVSLHEELKNTIIFPKIRPENLQKSQQKKGRQVVAFFLFSSTSGAPCPVGGSRVMPLQYHGYSNGTWGSCGCRFHARLCVWRA